MYSEGKNLTQYKRYYFNFASTGYFTLLDKNGKPLYDQVLPLFEKLVSHLIWVLFWIVLILVIKFSMAQHLFMACIFFHFFLFGCRLTTLLIKGGLKPILLPPLWVRLTRQFQKGKGRELLKRRRLENHPGLLANLAIAQHSRQQFSEMQDTLREALTLCPDHPVLHDLKFFLQKSSAKNPIPDNRSCR